jgi:Domain of unknown function (DUF5666)
MVSFRKVAVFIGIVGLLFGVASTVDAAHTQAHRSAQAGSSEPERLPGRGPGAPEMILTGPVTSVSPGTGFIVMSHGAGKNAEEIPIDIDNRTTLMRGGKKLTIDELKVGDRIRVSYTGQAGDVTKMVEVTGGPSARRGSRL